MLLLLFRRLHLLLLPLRALDRGMGLAIAGRAEHPINEVLNPQPSASSASSATLTSRHDSAHAFLRPFWPSEAPQKCGEPRCADSAVLMNVELP